MDIAKLPVNSLGFMSKWGLRRLGKTANHRRRHPLLSACCFAVAQSKILGDGNNNGKGLDAIIAWFLNSLTMLYTPNPTAAVH